MTTDTSPLTDLLTRIESTLRAGDFSGAKALLDNAQDLAASADPLTQARVQKLLGDFWRYQSNPYEAASLYEQVLTAATAAGDQRLLADAQLAYGRLKMPQGQQDLAWGLYESAGAIYATLGEPGLQGQTLAGQGDVAFHRGDAATARALFDQALTLCRQGEDALGEAHTLKSLGRLIQQQEGAEAALTTLKASVEAYQKSGFKYGEAFTWQYYAQVLGQERRLPEASAALGQAADLFHAIGLPGQEARMRDFKAQVDAAIADGLG